MDRHPLSAFWPDLPKDEKMELLADIRDNGVREPVVVKDGMILDGWHRYSAAAAAEVDCPLEELGEDIDPVAYVISKNHFRRHISKTQRARAVWLMKEWEKYGGSPPSEEPEEQTVAVVAPVAVEDKVVPTPQPEGAQTEVSVPEEPPSNWHEGNGSGSPSSDMGATHEEVADIAGVSYRTARRAKREIEEERGIVDAPLVESPSRNETVTELREKLEVADIVVETQTARIEEAIDERDAALEREAVLKSQVEGGTEEVEKTFMGQREEIKALRSQVGEWQTKYEEERQEKESLKSEVSRLREDKQSLTQEIEQLRRQNRRLKQAVPA